MPSHATDQSTLGGGDRRAPVAFVSHGAPPLALDRVMGADLAGLGLALGRPAAILVVSAHWERTPATLGATRTPRLVHDYGGFDPALREVVYPAPGAAALAERVEALVPGIRRDEERGWDHGVWVPLVHLYPAADVPVLELSLPSAVAPAALLELGRRLAPLRDESVLLLASGGAVHNLRRLDWREASPPPGWATAFETWLVETLARGDHDALADWREAAPDAAWAHPTPEHFLPLLVAAGAAGDRAVASFPVQGFEYGSLSRLAVRFGERDDESEPRSIV